LKVLFKNPIIILYHKTKPQDGGPPSVGTTQLLEMVPGDSFSWPKRQNKTHKRRGGVSVNRLSTPPWEPARE